MRNIMKEIMKDFMSALVFSILVFMGIAQMVLTLAFAGANVAEDPFWLVSFVAIAFTQICVLGLYLYCRK